MKNKRQLKRIESQSAISNSKRLPMKDKTLENSSILQEGSKQAMKIIQEIQSNPFFKSCAKHIKIKLQNWIQVLKGPQFNSNWRVNKTNYLKLLNLMCHCEIITQPFKSFPKKQLPIIRKHQINRIIDKIEKQVKKSKDPSKAAKKDKININKQQIKPNALKEFQQESTRHNKLKFNELLQNTFHQMKRITQGYIKTKRKINNKDVKDRFFFYESNSSAHHKNNFSKYQDKIQSHYQTQSSAFFPRIKNFDRLNNSNTISESISLDYPPNLLSSQILKMTFHKKNRPLSKFQSRTYENTPHLAKSYNNLSHRIQGIGNLEALKLENDPTDHTSQRKCYWQSSHTLTGNLTPKYLNNVQNILNVSVKESQQAISYRSSQKCICDCLPSLWGGQK